MILNKLFIFLFLFCAVTYAQDEGNYIITIGDETINYKMGEELEYDVRKKGPLKITVKQKEVLNYSDGIVSFNHNIHFPVSETILDEGIKQILAMSSTGTGVIIQEYEGYNPELMIDLMLNEITKESIDYGYKESVSPIEIITSDNKVMKGKKSILTYQGSADEWIVVAYGEKDKGVLVMTMLMDATGINVEANFIEDFFKSLKIYSEK